MTLAVPPKATSRRFWRWRSVARSMRRFSARSPTPGFSSCTFGSETVAGLDMEFLHEGRSRSRPIRGLGRRGRLPSPRGRHPRISAQRCSRCSRRLNLCSNEIEGPALRPRGQGPHRRQAVGRRGRDVPAEATVFLLRHGATHDGYVLSEGVNPFYSDIDTYAMARSVLDEAVRKQLCAGARLDRIAALDNFCWPDPVQSPSTPDGAYKMAQLVRACRGAVRPDAGLRHAADLRQGLDEERLDDGRGEDQRAPDAAPVGDRADRRRRGRAHARRQVRRGRRLRLGRDEKRNRRQRVFPPPRRARGRARPPRGAVRPTSGIASL